MARQRMIKPQFWSSPTLCNCSLQARLLFVASWNYADDEGRMLWDCRLLRVFAFPLDDISLADVQKWMDELEGADLVVKYTTKDAKLTYGYIRNFLEHQKIEYARPSKHPDPFGESSVIIHRVKFRRVLFRSSLGELSPKRHYILILILLVRILLRSISLIHRRFTETSPKIQRTAVSKNSGTPTKNLLTVKNARRYGRGLVMRIKRRSCSTFPNT